MFIDIMANNQLNELNKVMQRTVSLALCYNRKYKAINYLVKLRSCLYFLKEENTVRKLKMIENFKSNSCISKLKDSWVILLRRMIVIGMVQLKRQVLRMKV